MAEQAKCIKCHIRNIYPEGCRVVIADHRCLKCGGPVQATSQALRWPTFADGSPQARQGQGRRARHAK